MYLRKATRTNDNRDEYRILNKSVKAEVTNTKEEVCKKLYAEVERNGPKVIYKLAKTRQRRTKDTDYMTFINDKDDKILSKDQVIKNRWKGYFSTLLNARNNRKQLAVMQPTQGSIENIT